MPSGIPVHIELSHQSEEYSSENEPILALKSFHTATVASMVFALAKRCFRSRSTKSERSDSTTPDRLSVIPFACCTKSSFKVRLTGRFRASKLCRDFIAPPICALYAHPLGATIILWWGPEVV